MGVVSGVVAGGGVRAESCEGVTGGGVGVAPGEGVRGGRSGAVSSRVESSQRRVMLALQIMDLRREGKKNCKQSAEYYASFLLLCNGTLYSTL